MIDRADVYETARMDAATVNALNSNSDEPFWEQAYTNLIYKVRLASIRPATATRACGR